MANEKSAADKKAVLQKQMEALQAQMQELAQAEVHEIKLKLSNAREVVQGLEEELAELTGKPAGAPKKARKARSAPISDDILKDQIIKVMATHGKEGLNAKQLAEHVGQDPIRIRKYIKENPKALKRTGNAAATKFFLP